MWSGSGLLGWSVVPHARVHPQSGQLVCPAARARWRTRTRHFLCRVVPVRDAVMVIILARGGAKCRLEAGGTRCGWLGVFGVLHMQGSAMCVIVESTATPRGWTPFHNDRKTGDQHDQDTRHTLRLHLRLQVRRMPKSQQHLYDPILPKEKRVTLLARLAQRPAMGAMGRQSSKRLHVERAPDRRNARTHNLSRRQPPAHNKGTPQQPERRKAVNTNKPLQLGFYLLFLTTTVGHLLDVITCLP